MWVSPRPQLLDGISFSPLILDRHGEMLRLGLAEDGKYRVRIRLKDVSPSALQAILRYEDRFFYQHQGINPFSLIRAFWNTILGRRRMGGSTLTMQVVRLRQKKGTSNFIGKIDQIFSALQLEYHYTKDEILEAYCNLAPYGGNVEGVEAAARIWFHKSARRLTPEESLALAIIPQHPAKRHPQHGADFTLARARISNLWYGTGHNVPPLRIFGLEDLPFEAPHATTELLQSASNGSILQTTLDLGLQHSIERLIQQFSERNRVYGLDNAAALLVHWPTVEIRALVGSANFHDLTIQGQIDGTRAKRSPGSTLKPFIYAMALEQGLIHPMSLLSDVPRSFRGYDPENFDRLFRGPLSATEALQSSRNIPAITLASKLRAPGLYGFLQRAAISLPFSEEHYGLSLVLGGAEISPRDLARLYAMLANQGILRDLQMIKSTGTLPEGKRMLAPEATFMTLSMLEKDKMRAKKGFIPLYMKTGTSNGFRDAWTAGIFGEYVLIVWVGHFDNRSNPLFIGAEVATPLFRDIARSVLSAQAGEVQDLIADQAALLNLRQIEVCSATGDTETQLCPDKTLTWFWSGVSPLRSSGVFRTLLIDKVSGLRACVPILGRTEEVVWEFWSSDLQRLFLRAGIVKAPPPPYDLDGPSCRNRRPSAELPFSASGQAPIILIPKEGVTYQTRLTAAERAVIPLTATTDADTDQIFWFSDKNFLGQSKPNTSLPWIASPGIHEIRVVDGKGRLALRKIEVRNILLK